MNRPERIFFLLLFTFHFSLFTRAGAFDRSNVPLKNFGGFSIQHSWIYDALEKLVLAGLADQAILNTKPLSRVEAARIVAQAVRRVQEDLVGDTNHRGYLEGQLYRLVEELGPELAEMGVRTSFNRETSPAFFEYSPVDHAQFGVAFSDTSQRTINHFGREVSKGGNPDIALDGRVHVGDYLSLYYRPEFFADEDSNQGKFMSVYGKLTFWNAELLAGRDSLWWGPGFRGSMTFSNNAFPLDLVKVGSAEPFRLPWVLRRLGLFKVSTFVAQLDDDRDFPKAKLSGLRISVAPGSSLEFGFNRIFQFGGEGRPGLDPIQFLDFLFFRRGCDIERAENRTCVNNILSVDGTLRLSDVQRTIPLVRDMALYFDLGWDDTRGGDIIPRKPGGIAGVYLTGFLGDPALDFRFEYAQTSKIQFNHNIYTSGFTNRGSVLSHFIGTDGSDIFARLTRWINKDLMLGFQVSRAEVGSPAIALLNSPREKRSSFGFDLSYRVSDRSSIFLGYDFARVKNSGFVAGRSSYDNLFRFEFTRRFGQ